VLRSLFVDEDQVARIEVELTFEPLFPRSQHPHAAVWQRAPSFLGDAALCEERMECRPAGFHFALGRKMRGDLGKRDAPIAGVQQDVSDYVEMFYPKAPQKRNAVVFRVRTAGGKVTRGRPRKGYSLIKSDSLGTVYSEERIQLSHTPAPLSQALPACACLASLPACPANRGVAPAASSHSSRCLASAWFDRTALMVVMSRP
jgi:hypothetical protein